MCTFEMAHFQINVFRADDFLARFASRLEFRICKIGRKQMIRSDDCCLANSSPLIPRQLSCVVAQLVVGLSPQGQFWLSGQNHCWMASHSVRCPDVVVTIVIVVDVFA